jgi:hypothetical protein
MLSYRSFNMFFMVIPAITAGAGCLNSSFNRVMLSWYEVPEILYSTLL